MDDGQQKEVQHAVDRRDELEDLKMSQKEGLSGKKDQN